MSGNYHFGDKITQVGNQNYVDKRGERSQESVVPADLPDFVRERRAGSDASRNPGKMSGDGLLRQEIDALAAAYSTPTDAELLLSRAGLAPENLPVFGNSMTSRGFWTKVSQELALGRVLHGRRKLLTTASDDYPGNPAFRLRP